MALIDLYNTFNCLHCHIIICFAKDVFWVVFMFSVLTIRCHLSGVFRAIQNNDFIIFYYNFYY